MKKKFFLPMMAFVFAIGLSFATERSTADPSWDYYMTEVGKMSIEEVTNCGNDEEAECTIQLVPNGPAYELFDDEALTIPKFGGNRIELH